MKLKILFLLILLSLPHFGMAYYTCHPCCSRFQLPGWWFGADYLLLWRKERFFPALVTTNPAAAPVLSNPDTRILFGDEEVGGVPRSGWKFDLGLWVTRCWGFGIGGFGLKNDKVNFSIEGDAGGNPIIGRPFFNTSTAAEDALIISFPPAIAINGLVDIDTDNDLWGVDLYARYRFLASCQFKFDLIAGFLFSRIHDDLEIVSRSTSPLGPTITRVEDRFDCRNDYYSGIVGIMSEWRSCNWALTLAAKVGFGNMVKRVNIFGETRTTAGGVVTVTEGGLLAQPSNIGFHSVNKFEVVPQVTADVQLRLIGHLWLKVGYTYMFWPAVALAGRQVDLNINPTQVPGPVVGTPAPLFKEVDKSFWVQGLTAGFYIFY